MRWAKRWIARVVMVTKVVRLPCSDGFPRPIRSQSLAPFVLPSSFAAWLCNASRSRHGFHLLHCIGCVPSSLSFASRDPVSMGFFPRVHSFPSPQRVFSPQGDPTCVPTGWEDDTHTATPAGGGGVDRFSSFSTVRISPFETERRTVGNRLSFEKGPIPFYRCKRPFRVRFDWEGTGKEPETTPWECL